VHVADQAGAPVAASIVMKESGSEQPVQADATGTYTWVSVNGPGVNLQVSAPGYFAAAQPATLQRGPNEMAVILQADPMALAAADACAPNEKLLYLEDFQSGKVADWRLTSGAADGWGVTRMEDGNQVLSISGMGITQVQDSALVMDNAVVRLRILTTGKDGDSFINFKHFLAGGDTRYIFQWCANRSLFLTRFDGANGKELKMSGSQFRARPGEWQYLEISNYQGSIQAWTNGQRTIEAQDPTPLPAGGLSLEAHINADPKQAYLFDNISVCELSAPFSTSLYKPPQ
jgi:hypothetical protein